LKGPLAATLAAWLSLQSAWPAAPAGQTRQPVDESATVAVLQIRVLEGEGAVVGMGGKSSRGIVVQVTDETGRPVEGAAVSFHLPTDGPSGTFLSGLKTEIATTAPDGKVSVYGIEWNSVPGPVQVRVTAAKGEARAGVIVNLYVSDKPVTETAAERRERGPGVGGSHKGRWILLVLLAAGAGGGAALGMAQSKASTAGGSVPPPAGTPTVGTPTISVGKP
jgi:hypothetical protein